MAVGKTGGTMQALWVQSLPKLVQEVSLPAIQAQVTVERALLDTETGSGVCLYIDTHGACSSQNKGLYSHKGCVISDHILLAYPILPWLLRSFPPLLPFPGYHTHICPSRAHSHPSLVTHICPSSFPSFPS